MLKNILVVLCLVGIVFALQTQLPTNDTNIAKTSIASINYETVSASLLFDGIVSAKPEYSVVFPKRNAAHGVVVKLSHIFYIREIRIIADAKLPPAKVQVRYSKTTDDWLALTDISVTDVGETKVYTVRGEYAATNWLSFIFDTPTQDARILDIEIYPETSLRLKNYFIKDHWAIADTEAFDDVDTRIDTSRQLWYSQFGSSPTESLKTKSLAILEDEQISVGNLLPGTAYEYKLSILDYNANALDTDKRQFSTKPRSFAYQKTYMGTFNTAYEGGKVTGYPLTDGQTDVNFMAISGTVKNADQYVLIDLGAEKDISTVVAYWRALGYSKDYSILLSTDNQNWTTVAEHQSGDAVTQSRTAEGHPLRAVFSVFPKAKARYIKLFAAKGSAYYSKHGSSTLELLEIKAF